MDNEVEGSPTSLAQDDEAIGIKASTESGQVFLNFTKYDLKDDK